MHFIRCYLYLVFLIQLNRKEIIYMKVIFVSVYLEIECRLISIIMNYSLNLDFCSSFCRIFYQIKYIFNTFSLFYEDYRFLFNQANWDHQDEILVPLLRGSYRMHKVLIYTIEYEFSSLFYGVVIE